MFKKIIRAGAIAMAAVMAVCTTGSYTSEATVSVSTETVVAGASAAVNNYCSDASTRTKVRNMLGIKTTVETTAETTKESTEESTVEPETSETEETESVETTPEETTEAVPETTYIVSTAEQYVNVRSTPDASDTSNIVGKMYKDAVGIVLSTEKYDDGYWYFMQSGDVQGYVKADYFMTGSEAEEYMALHSTNIGTVTNTAVLNVRSAPTIASDIIAQLHLGDKYVLLGVENGFYLIQLDESFIGYIAAQYVTITSTYKTAISLDAERIAAEQAAEEEAARQAAEAAAEAEAAAAAEAARLANTLVSISAYYMGGIKYAGQVVAASEVSVIGTYGDGSTKPVSGWSCPEIGIPLGEGEIVFYVTYEGQTTTFTVTGASVAPVVVPTTASSASSASAVTQTAQAETSATHQGTFVACQLLAAYCGNIKYAGQTVSRDEIEVMAAFSNNIDYAYTAYVTDWTCDQIGVPLQHGDTVFHICYQGLTYDITINAYQESGDTSLRGQIVSYAVQFLGNPYVYGGTDLVNGCDCSGFTQSIYKHFGYNIPRSSYDQPNGGVQIDPANVQPGDLVFYTNTSTGRIGHVGLYIGEGKIIHAANESLGIIISNMYYRQPACVVSVIND